MMNYCPVCRASLNWISSDNDNCGDQIIWYTTSECEECHLQVHETEVYTRTEVNAEFTFKED